MTSTAPAASKSFRRARSGVRLVRVAPGGGHRRCPRVAGSGGWPWAGSTPRRLGWPGFPHRRQAPRKEGPTWPSISSAAWRSRRCVRRSRVAPRRARSSLPRRGLQTGARMWRWILSRMRRVVTPCTWAWDVRTDGFGMKLDVFLKDDWRGPFAGLEAGLSDTTLRSPDGAHDRDTSVLVGGRVGWRVPFPAGFYVTPWVGLDYALDAGDRTVGAFVFDGSPWCSSPRCTWGIGSGSVVAEHLCLSRASKRRGEIFDDFWRGGVPTLMWRRSLCRTMIYAGAMHHWMKRGAPCCS